MAPSPHPAPGAPVVAHVSQPTSAGVANVVLELVRDEVRRGWDVHVACPDDEVRRMRCLDGLVSDGLVEPVSRGRYRLPG